MSKQEVPLTGLTRYLPEGSYEMVYEFLKQYKVELTVTRKRSSVLGDYRKSHNSNHRISVNGDLNRYSFLITLLHELAHLVAYEVYHDHIQPHGKEWKQTFSTILSGFVQKGIFPTPVENALKKSLHNAAASACGDLNLLRVLKQYDTNSVLFVENIEEGGLFKIRGNQIFRRGKKIRTRIQCEEVATKKVYSFHSLYEVEKVDA